MVIRCSIKTLFRVLNEDSHAEVETAMVRDSSIMFCTVGIVLVTDDLAMSFESRYLSLLKKRRASSNSVSFSIKLARSASGCRADFSMKVDDAG